MSKRKIMLEIADDLSPQEEVFHIAKLLSGKKGIGNGQKLIGVGMTVKESSIEIEVRRIPKEKPLKTSVCSICQTVFESKRGLPLYTNYGGVTRKLLYCSTDCQSAMIDLFGGQRVHFKRNQLISPITR